MVEHLVGMPVVSKDRIASVHSQHGVIAFVGCFRAHVARGSALLAFGDDVTFLTLRFDFRLVGCVCNWFRAHTVSATAAASVAAAMLVRFFASAAWIKASGS